MSASSRAQDALLVMAGRFAPRSGAAWATGAEGGAHEPALPPLRLRTAYTQKGLGIGVGALIGSHLGGPIAALGCAYAGWMVGNALAIRAEEEFTQGRQT